eukprot:6182864-Pleurochrysis_carterae.AAC.2
MCECCNCTGTCTKHVRVNRGACEQILSVSKYVCVCLCLRILACACNRHVRFELEVVGLELEHACVRAISPLCVFFPVLLCVRVFCACGIAYVCACLRTYLRVRAQAPFHAQRSVCVQARVHEKQRQESAEWVCVSALMGAYVTCVRTLSARVRAVRASVCISACLFARLSEHERVLAFL